MGYYLVVVIPIVDGKWAFAFRFGHSRHSAALKGDYFKETRRGQLRGKSEFYGPEYIRQCFSREPEHKKPVNKYTLAGAKRDSSLRLSQIKTFFYGFLHRGVCGFYRYRQQNRSGFGQRVYRLLVKQIAAQAIDEI